MKHEPILLVDGHHGVYVPQVFAERALNGDYRIAEDLDEELKECLQICSKGAAYDGEEYWEAWEYILNNMTLNGELGDTYYLDQNDGDLWAVPTDTSLEDHWE